MATRQRRSKLKRSGKSRVDQLGLNEFTTPRTNGRLRGVSVGRDEDGIFVMTHRARSKSYKSQSAIPTSVIKRIASTG